MWGHSKISLYLFSSVEWYKKTCLSLLLIFSPFFSLTYCYFLCYCEKSGGAGDSFTDSSSGLQQTNSTQHTWEFLIPNILVKYHQQNHEFFFAPWYKSVSEGMLHFFTTTPTRHILNKQLWWLFNLAMSIGCAGGLVKHDGPLLCRNVQESGSRARKRCAAGPRLKYMIFPCWFMSCWLLNPMPNLPLINKHPNGSCSEKTTKNNLLSFAY